MTASEQCWCCGRDDAPDRMVHLGEHPEVALCLGCAHWASKQAAEIEDAGHTGLAVRARTVMRSARQIVIRRGWHRLPVVGAALRRLGRHTP